MTYTSASFVKAKKVEAVMTGRNCVNKKRVQNFWSETPCENSHLEDHEQDDRELRLPSNPSVDYRFFGVFTKL